MGDLIQFPLERRQKQIAAEAMTEYVQQPGWFGVRLRPPDVVVPAGTGLNITITHWLGEPVITDGSA